MAKLTRARKREIREKVREAVAYNVRELDPKCFEGIGENSEEDEYALKERDEIANRLLYKAEDKAEAE
jgi:hypothetical protein